MAGTIPADCLISCILGYPTLLPLGAADLLLTASFWQHEIINWLFTSLAVRSNVLVTGGTTISEVLTLSWILVWPATYRINSVVFAEIKPCEASTGHLELN